MCYPSIDPLLAPFCQWQASQWMTPKVGTTFSVTNPATGAIIATLPNQTAGDALAAIDRASAALPAWQALPAIKQHQVYQASEPTFGMTANLNAPAAFKQLKTWLQTN
jgi:ABC-type Fe3+-hydroxamate transport system substrate-binding protein